DTPSEGSADGRSGPRFDRRLRQHFRVRRFATGDRLRALADYRHLRFGDSRSPLRKHLHDLADAFRGQPVAGILLFSDGADSGAAHAGERTAAATRTPTAAAPRARPASAKRPAGKLPPIYPVLLGRPAQRPNLAITDVRVAETLFEDTPVTLAVEVLAVHATGRSLRAAVFDAAGTLVEQRTVPIQRDRSRLELLFRLAEPVRRKAFARVQVGLADEWDPTARGGPKAALLDEPDHPTTETTLADNDRTVELHGHAERHRILYVSGRPNWEWKFLRRAVERDPRLQLTGLIRIARREAKFDFRGRPGERTNALFRGFDAAAEESEQYDEPVFLRLNTRNENELRRGFPNTAEDLFAFDAVVLDDIEAAFFTRDQLALLQRFVSERGGTLMMLGGVDTFAHGGYDRTVLADVLPVYMDRPHAADRAAAVPAPARRTGPSPAAAYRFRKTRQGRLEPWLRLDRSIEDDARHEDALPSLHVITPARTVKPAATILAHFTDTAGHPAGLALVTQRYGRGRAVAFLAGDLWRWRLKTPSAHDAPDRFWRQLARWLVADVPPRHELTIDHPSADAGTLRCRIHCRDRSFAPDTRAAVRIEVYYHGREAVSNAPPGPTRRPQPPQVARQASIVLPAVATTPQSGAILPVDGTLADKATATTQAETKTRTSASLNPSLPSRQSPPTPPGRWRRLHSLTARPVADRPGVYEAVFHPPGEGLLWIVAHVRPHDARTEAAPGDSAVVLQRGWVESPRVAEFRPLQTENGGALQRLAAESGGEVVPLEQLETFVDSLPHRKLPVSRTHRKPLWHSPWMLVAAFTALIGEWYWRRRHGLA
ncbi:MAG: hypothetical protein D6725_02955, partial [Planctomycetota bacterium]